MATNFWKSTHYQNWLKNSTALFEQATSCRVEDHTVFTENELEMISISFAQFISVLARKANLRQRVAATAIVYFKRFYCRNCYKEHDPRLIAPVALYLAAKTEEHTLQAKSVVTQMNQNYKADHPYPYTVADIYDSEFLLLFELDFDLIVFHPYNSLVKYAKSAHVDDCVPMAWSILNDSYRTNVSLRYPPFLIATACLFMACTALDRDIFSWIHKMNINTGDLSTIVKTISATYIPSIQGTDVNDFLDVINTKLQTHFGSKIQQTGLKMR